MKVYEIATAHPTSSRHKDFASLDCKRTDTKYFATVKYGRPSIDWRTRELRVYNPAAPRPDIFHMSLDYIISPRAFDILGGLLNQSAELLPVTIKGEVGTHYFYNCTNVIDVLDPESTIYEYFKEAISYHTTVVIPAFHADRLRECSLFRSRHSVHRIFYVEHESAQHGGDVKALTEQHRLTGWRSTWSGAILTVQLNRGFIGK